MGLAQSTRTRARIAEIFPPEIFGGNQNALGVVKTSTGTPATPPTRAHGMIRVLWSPVKSVSSSVLSPVTADRHRPGVIGPRPPCAAVLGPLAARFDTPQRATYTHVRTCMRRHDSPTEPPAHVRFVRSQSPGAVTTHIGHLGLWPTSHVWTCIPSDGLPTMGPAARRNGPHRNNPGHHDGGGGHHHGALDT